MTYTGPMGRRTAWRADGDLPVEGSVEVRMPVEELWQSFAKVRGWPRWNGCMWTATVTGGELAEGRTLVWAFLPLRRYLPYRLPAIARLTEVVPERRVTWEVTLLPGFHARHTYWMEPLDAERSRFGSWEVAEGPFYRLLRPFWLAHFRFVCHESLRGVERLAAVRAQRILRLSGPTARSIQTRR